MIGFDEFINSSPDLEQEARQVRILFHTRNQLNSFLKNAEKLMQEKSIRMTIVVSTRTFQATLGFENKAMMDRVLTTLDTIHMQTAEQATQKNKALVNRWIEHDSDTPQ